MGEPANHASRITFHVSPIADMDIRNKIILITGSAGRIGKAIALLLAQKGARPVIHYHSSRDKARETAGEIAAIGQPPLVVQGDLSQPESWLKIRDEILDAFGRVDVLVNNAAVFYKTPLRDVTEAQWDHLLNVNLKSVFWGCKILGEVMQRQEGGKIINISDVAGEQVWTNYLPYSVSKAGVIALTKGMAKALAPHVTVNVITPGMALPAESIAEENLEILREEIPLKRFGSAEDVAGAVAFLIEGSDYMTGAEIKIDGGRTLL